MTSNHDAASCSDSGAFSLALQLILTHKASAGTGVRTNVNPSDVNLKAGTQRKEAGLGLWMGDDFSCDCTWCQELLLSLRHDVTDSETLQTTIVIHVVMPDLNHTDRLYTFASPLAHSSGCAAVIKSQRRQTANDVHCRGALTLGSEATPLLLSPQLLSWRFLGRQGRHVATRRRRAE